eukprot:6212927-Pleurochrysis_carterae.AAC.6
MFDVYPHRDGTQIGGFTRISHSSRALSPVATGQSPRAARGSAAQHSSAAYATRAAQKQSRAHRARLAFHLGPRKSSAPHCIAQRLTGRNTLLDRTQRFPARPMAVVSISEEMVRMNKQITEVMELEDKAKREVAELEQQLKAAQQRKKSRRASLLTMLQQLRSKPVTVKALEKSLIGVSVNKLRKHEHEPIATTSEQIVRAWKTIVEKTEGRAVPQSSQRGSAASHSRSPHPTPPKREAGVLDMVRDDRGRVEKRRADPDCFEDQLALTEAEMAERMWEEQMGGGSQRRKIASALTCASPSDHDSEPASPGSLKRSSAVARLREGYKQFDEKKKQRELIKLDHIPSSQRAGNKGPSGSQLGSSKVGRSRF